MSATTPPPLPPPEAVALVLVLVLVEANELWCVSASISEALIISGPELGAFGTESFESTSPSHSAVSASTCASSDRRAHTDAARRSAPGPEESEDWTQ